MNTPSLRTHTNVTVNTNLAAILVPTLIITYLLGFLTAVAIFAIRAMLLRRQQQEKDHAEFIKRLNESARHTKSVVYDTIQDPTGGESHTGNIRANNPLYSEQSVQENEEDISLNTNNAYSLNKDNVEEVYTISTEA